MQTLRQNGSKLAFENIDEGPREQRNTALLLVVYNLFAI